MSSLSLASAAVAASLCLLAAYRPYFAFAALAAAPFAAGIVFAELLASLKRRAKPSLAKRACLLLKRGFSLQHRHWHLFRIGSGAWMVVRFDSDSNCDIASERTFPKGGLRDAIAHFLAEAGLE